MFVALGLQMYSRCVVFILLGLDHTSCSAPGYKHLLTVSPQVNMSVLHGHNTAIDYRLPFAPHILPEGHPTFPSLSDGVSGTS